MIKTIEQPLFPWQMHVYNLTDYSLQSESSLFALEKSIHCSVPSERSLRNQNVVVAEAIKT